MKSEHIQLIDDTAMTNNFHEQNVICVDENIQLSK